MSTAQIGTVSQNASPQLESRIAVSQIEAQLKKGLKPIEEQDIRKAFEGDYGRLIDILGGNFDLYKLVVNQVGWRYSGVLEEADAWFSTAYSLIVAGMGDDKFHKSPVREVFRKYGEFVDSKQYTSQLGIAAMVTTPPQLQPKNSE